METKACPAWSIKIYGHACVHPIELHPWNEGQSFGIIHSEQAILDWGYRHIVSMLAKETIPLERDLSQVIFCAARPNVQATLTEAEIRSLNQVSHAIS